mmetsp:Transcript_104288/g.326283  ORF Transcript_104288/g.326283 Transcript_104288/m.326283 type:complete len:214 (-) Transcript_104288:272-913(-)
MPFAHSLSKTCVSMMAPYVRTALMPAAAISSASLSTYLLKSARLPPFGTGFQQTPFRWRGCPPTRIWRPLISIRPAPAGGRGPGAGSGLSAQAGSALGRRQVQSMSEVPEMGVPQEPAYASAQLSARSSAAATHTWPKLAQYEPQLPPYGCVRTRALQPPQVTPLSTFGHWLKGTQHSLPLRFAPTSSATSSSSSSISRACALALCRTCLRWM